MNLEKQRMNNLVFYTYYQQLCVLIADKPWITKQVTDMYIKRIIFAVDMNIIYIKPRGIKNVDWHTDAYRMEPEDIDEITKDWTEEWKSSTLDMTNLDENTLKEKDKGKEKLGEKKDKEHTGEKRKAPQDDLKPHKRTKLKSEKPPTYGQLGVYDYENNATCIQETLEPPMTSIVSSQTALKSVLDMQIAELKTLLE